MKEKILEKKALLSAYPAYAPGWTDVALTCSLKDFDKKIIVLDDDPTGIQTVHDVYVYTDWDKASLLDAFLSETPIFFILTNSRSFTAIQTREAHTQIMLRILEVSQATGKDFVVISRGDSTLRGHYPLETEQLKETAEQYSDKRYDGEILLPFFPEGGRFTAEDVHYVADGERLIPAGDTEFARDKTFGYHSSHLGEWIEEKSGGRFKQEQVTSITLEELRACDIQGIRKKLENVHDFNKIIVNAISYDDVKVFVSVLAPVIMQGGNFLFRTAAAFPKVLGNIPDRALLCREELIACENPNGGIIVAGSYVHKTTRQLECLKNAGIAEFIEFNQHLVTDEALFSAELHRVIETAEDRIRKGQTVVVHTRRDRFDLNTSNKEDELKVAIKISDALTSVVSELQCKPAFIIAKGGITSSDIGTKALRVKKALVLGQILPGIPVWQIQQESKFPGLAYVIFPGNVGSDTALLEAVEIMQNNHI